MNRPESSRRWENEVVCGGATTPARCLASAAATEPAKMSKLSKHCDATEEPEAAYETAINHALEIEDEEVARTLPAMLEAKLPESELMELYGDILLEGEDEEEMEDAE